LRQAPAVVGRADAPIVGIDFGTTYSKVALVHEGEVVLVEDEASKSSSRAAIPSAVAFLPGGSGLVGDPARELLATAPHAVITSVKRVMGLTFSDPLANGLLGSLSCGSHAGPNDSIVFEMNGQAVTVPEVCARIITHLKGLASKWAGAPVRKAVFTVPVDFDIRSKRELEIAARMAGIEIAGLVPEPVAAAMGCGHDGSGQSYVAVYDFGGGTFDASIVEVGQNRFTVRGAAGDRWLGGDDFDEVLARYVADEFQRSAGVSLHNRAEEWQRLLFACEEAKRWLSTLESVDIILPEAGRMAQGSHSLLVPMNRPLFDELSEDIVTSSLEVSRTAAIKARVHPRKIDSLLITGGTTRIPAVRNAAERFFGRRGLSGIHPEHAVVIGAAVRAAVIGKVPVPGDFVERLRGLGRVGQNVGLALAGGTTEHIITADQRPPTAARRVYSTSRDGQTQIRLELVQGSSVRTAENHRLGGFVIQGLPQRPAGAITLDVYFELSSTGTLYVTAQERSTGLRAQGTFDLQI
jgi:molecular chaperone DnaK